MAFQKKFQQEQIVIARKLPDFVADIELLPAEAAGRKSALMGGEWRTVLGVNGAHWSAMLRFEGEPVPGVTFEAAVWLLMSDAALPGFQIGKIFEVWEGGTKGWGRVKRRPEGNPGSNSNHALNHLGHS